MAENFKELEKHFIVEDDIEHETIKQLISQILNFCKVDKNGYVIIFNKNFKKIDKILLILSARYLGNRLQQELGKEVTIQEEVTNIEIANILKEKQTIVSARLKDLKDDRKVFSVRRGVYKVAPYVIAKFLNKLEEETKNE